MKSVIISCFVAFASAMTIETSLGQAAQPSKLPEACQQYKSVSANPPCVYPCEGVNYCPPPRNLEDSLGKPIAKESASDLLDRNPVRKKDTEILTVSSAFPDNIPSTQKRGLETFEDSGIQSPGKTQDPKLVSNPDSTFRMAAQMGQFEAHVSEFYERAKGMKIGVANDPRLFDTAYPQLKQDFEKVKSERLALEIVSQSLLKDIEDKLGYSQILLQMLDLNLLMRQKGNGDLLDVIKLNPDRDTSESQKTKISTLFETLQDFSVIMWRCYDVKGRPDFKDPSFKRRVGFVRHRFDALKVYAYELIAEATPLARILNEELNAIDSGISDLEESAKRHQAYSSLPSQAKAVTFSDLDNIPKLTEQEKMNSANQQHLTLMENSLLSAFSNNPQLAEDLNLGEYKNWRMRLHEVCDDVFLELLQMGLKNGPAKKRIEDLLNEMTYELSRKANSVLAVATMVSSDGSFKGENSLLDFSDLYDIPKSDILHLENIFKSISGTLDEIDKNSGSLGKAGVERELSIQNAIFRRAAAYIHVSEWSALPETQKLRKLSKQISGKIKEMEATARALEREMN